MAPLIPSAKVTLSYPLYACDFDPLDDSRLVVAGGGGAGRTGVGNIITLLDTSNSSQVTKATEIELSKEEDNVTSLAVGAQKDKATLIFAGVNSSPAEVEKGLNAHFRVLGLQSAPRILEQSRASLFQGRERDAYQRITRLSKPYPGFPQLGAVTTGLAKNSEVALFDTSATNPPVSRGAVESGKEAEDVDVIQIADDEYLFAYCDEHDIYLKKISPEPDTEEPECIYITPATRSREKPSTPKFRALRFLSKEFLIMLTNIHSNGGAVLQIFRLPPSGKGQCRLTQSLRLPDRITKATGLAVCNLTPPRTPSEPQGYTQFVVAVAGHDISLSLYKIDLQVAATLSFITGIKSFRTFRNVHPLQITSLAFSNFTPPEHPITANTPPQYLKLASVGISNTVVVHTFPLFPVPLSMKRGQSTTPRYVIALPSTAAAMGTALVLSVIGIALAAVFIQSFLEIRGGVPVYLNVRNHVPLIWQERLGRPYEFPSDYSVSKTTDPVIGHHKREATDSVFTEYDRSHETMTNDFITPAPTLKEPTPTEWIPGPSSEGSYAPFVPPKNWEPGTKKCMKKDTEEPINAAKGKKSTKSDTKKPDPPLQAKRDIDPREKPKGPTHDQPDLRLQAAFIDRLKEGGQWNRDLEEEKEQVEKKHGKGRHWEELGKKEKEHWLKALRDAGDWVDDLPENVFKGVLFGELGGVVGRAVAGA